nr:MAG TPA: hypothetical protein [Caudoviricetes sp.]
MIETAIASNFSPEGAEAQFSSRSPGDILQPVNAGKNHFEKIYIFQKLFLEKFTNFKNPFFGTKLSL